MAAKEHDPLDELVRLQVLQLRRTAKSQAEMIIEMGTAGFGQTRIAELLGTTPNTVNVTLQRAKNGRGSAKKATPRVPVEA
jgi:DNA-binding CsgD family transcriptional regulator